MKKLTLGIKKYFNNNEKKYNVKKIIISGPDEVAKENINYLTI